MRGPWTAFKFLSVLGRFGKAPGSPEQIGSAAAYFPVVGATLGVALIFLHRLLEPFLESEIEAAVLVLALILMTAALHLEGTQKTIDRLSAPTNVHPLSIYGVIAVILVITFKIRAIEVMGETRNVNLLLAPVLARWSLIIFLYGSAWTGEESAWRVARNVRAWHLLVTSAAVLGLTGYLTGRAGLWVSFSVSVVALVSRNYFRRRFAGFTHEHLGALIEINEALSLVLLASL